MKILSPDVNKITQPYTINYIAGLVSSIVYTNGDIKTFNYTSGVLTSIVYNTKGIITTRSFAYDGTGNLITSSKYFE